MVKHAGVSRFLIRRVIMDDIRLAPYKKKHSVQVISESSKLKNLDSDKLMLTEMEPVASKIFIWSDKKLYRVEAVTNKQNNRAYTLNSGDSSVNI